MILYSSGFVEASLKVLVHSFNAIPLFKVISILNLIQTKQTELWIKLCPTSVTEPKPLLLTTKQVNKVRDELG